MNVMFFFQMNLCRSGEFAEAVREQFLAEQLEFIREVQRLLYLETGGEEAASKPQFVKALMIADPTMTDKQVTENLHWFVF